MPIFRGIPASAGVAEPLPLPRALEVDAGEDHGQLRRLQLDAVGPGGGGHLERPGLEPLVPEGQAVAVEVEDLEAIPAAVDEEEEVAAEEVLAEAPPDQAREAVEALAHVGGPGAEEGADGRGEHDHGLDSSPARPAIAAPTRPSHSGEGGESKRSRTWCGNSSSTPPGLEGGPSGRVSSRRSGTNKGGFT